MAVTLTFPPHFGHLSQVHGCLFWGRVLPVFPAMSFALWCLTTESTISSYNSGIRMTKWPAGQCGRHSVTFTDALIASEDVLRTGSLGQTCSVCLHVPLTALVRDSEFMVASQLFSEAFLPSEMVFEDILPSQVLYKPPIKWSGGVWPKYFFQFKEFFF